MRDWHEWYRSYEDPSSSLSRRLTVVRQRVAEVLSAPRETGIRVLSLCAGDGRDVLPLLAEWQPPTEWVVLVELDPGLAESARTRAAELGLERVAVINGDAGDPSQFTDAHPVDLLLLCGIFGNVSDADIRSTVAATPALLRDGGTVIWTRGSTTPDLRPAIRGWFERAGLCEVAFDGQPDGFGVGVARRPAGLTAGPPVPTSLFRFR